MKKRITTTILIIAGILGFSAGIGLYTAKYFQTDISSRPVIQGLLWPNPKQITAFETIDHSSQSFGLDQLLGKWTFLFFGYTHCPDVCPITLSVLDNVHQQLEKNQNNNNVQTVFISVDPERDTPKQLGEYVRYFNPDFIGLGGTEDQINSLGNQIGIVYIHGEKKDSTDYSVDHTASVFLIDPKGRLVGIFSAPQETNDMLNRFLAMQSYIDGQS
jgi:protein SCO1/2